MRLCFIFFVACIVSCTRTTNDACRINGNEDYLYSAPLLSTMCAPNGAVLPAPNTTYEIGNATIVFDNNTVNIGKKLDICPPNLSY